MNYNTEALKNFIVTEGGFIFNPTTGEILSTNEVGIAIVNCLKEGKSDVGDITQHLREIYDAEEQVIDKDIREFIPMLINLGLMSIDPN